MIKKIAALLIVFNTTFCKLPDTTFVFNKQNRQLTKQQKESLQKYVSRAIAIALAGGASYYFYNNWHTKTAFIKKPEAAKPDGQPQPKPQATTPEEQPQPAPEYEPVRLQPVYYKPPTKIPNKMELLQHDTEALQHAEADMAQRIATEWFKKEDDRLQEKIDQLEMYVKSLPEDTQAYFNKQIEELKKIRKNRTNVDNIKFDSVQMFQLQIGYFLSNYTQKFTEKFNDIVDKLKQQKTTVQ